MKQFVPYICGLLIPFSLFAEDTAGTELQTENAGRENRTDLAVAQNLSHEILQSVTGIDISPDGRYLYSAAFNGNSVAVFKRDMESGEMELIQAMSNPDLRTAVSIRLSPDGKYAAVAAFNAGTVTFFKRDSATGKLEQLDIVRRVPGAKDGLDFVIDVRFSADGRFLYTAASNGVGVYKIEDAKLVFVQLQGAAGTLAGVRDVVLSPDETVLYAPACQSHTVGVLRRDAATGVLEVIEILSDGENNINALGGAFQAACSADGKHVYISSGRFGGDQAVSVYAVQGDGKLRLVEEHVNGKDGFEGFEGGNDIKISPDGRLVYALGTLSDRLVRFRRDLETGRLTFLGSQEVGQRALPGSAGLCFSPDGRFVYIADEDASSIVVLKQR